MNAHRLAIDAALIALQLLARLRISFGEVKAIYDEAESRGEFPSDEQRNAIAQKARDSIDYL